MYVATLIASSEKKNLSLLIIEDIVNDLGGIKYNVLGGNVAADIFLETEPLNFEIIWKKLQKNKIDIVLQPIKNRRKKILLADMDSTMIQQECIDELADEAGVGNRVAGITKRAMNGELDFDEALIERVRLLKGLPKKIIDNVLETRITLMPGAESLIKTMKNNGSYCALVSGGFTDFTAAISKLLGFDEDRANTLMHENEKLSGKVKFPILGKQAKVDALIDITKRQGYDYSDVIAVGDGANDLGMLIKAGMGVALHAKPIVAAQCSARLNFANLEGLLYLQGYSDQEII
ncbi:phosphoserine phosphatase SerB [Amylibacter sp.]|jgi:phosphoserine phosphatase|nr:phosphoserine phosphatase SerB [Amylibacter sp.]